MLHVRPEERLARWGLVQHRQVTLAQLHSVGWGSSVINDRVAQGRLHPTFHRVHSLGGPARTDRERWMAATLSFGDGNPARGFGGSRALRLAAIPACRGSTC